MNKRIKKIFLLFFIVFGVFLLVAVIIPLVHDFIFDRVTISNYEEKEGKVSDVILKEDKDNRTCEHIIVDNYDIFIQCKEDYKQQFNIGDKTKYYVYKGKGYHTEAQMKSASFVGKIVDYGMIGSYILIFFLIVHNERNICILVDSIGEK